MNSRATPGLQIPLRPAGEAHDPHDAPYRRFIAASLALGVGGGFLLGLLLPLARAERWGWGEGNRYQALVQAHGQLQLMGFGGLFIMGMVLRLLPRIAARDLAWPRMATPALALVAISLVPRALSRPCVSRAAVSPRRPPIRRSATSP